MVESFKLASSIKGNHFLFLLLGCQTNQVMLHLVNSTIGAKSARIARISNNPE